MERYKCSGCIKIIHECFCFKQKQTLKKNAKVTEILEMKGIKPRFYSTEDCD
jgi:predicted Ser/Thr protein kinase